MGSFCSGLNAFWLALEKINMDKRAVDKFAVDVEASCRNLLQHNFEIENIFEDVFALNLPSLPAVDIFTAGFPCQPFSKAGLHGGLLDSRGSVVFQCIKYVATALPKAFILENVSGLVSNHWSAFKDIIRRLRAINEDGEKAYKVVWRVLNSKEHGLPQNRPRVLIVGIKLSCETERKFTWPAPVPMKPLSKILGPRDPLLTSHSRDTLPTSGVHLRNLMTLAMKVTQDGGVVGKDYYVGDLQSGRGFGPTLMKDVSPCLTKARCQGGGYWLFSHGRFMTVHEMLALQGVPPRRITVPANVSASKFKGMIGNAFDVNLFARVMLRLLPAVGIKHVMKDDLSNAGSDAEEDQM